MPRFLPLRKGRKCKVINISNLPSSCYSDSSICGDFLTEKCKLREALRNGRAVLQC